MRVNIRVPLRVSFRVPLRVTTRVYTPREGRYRVIVRVAVRGTRAWGGMLDYNKYKKRTPRNTYYW